MFDWTQISDSINSAVIGGGTVGSEQSFTVGIRNALFGQMGQIMPVLMGWLVTATLIASFYGAFMYFTAYGNEQKALQAKKTIVTALVGFVIAGLSFTFVTYFQRIFISESVEQGLENNTLPKGTTRTEIESTDSAIVPTGQSNPFEGDIFK